MGRQKFVHNRSAITLIWSQKSLSLFSRLNLAVVSVTGALQGRLSVFPTVGVSFIFQILSNLILSFYYHSHGYSFTFVCFFSLSLPILTEIRVLKLLDKCWYLTIPRCCLAVDSKETSAWKTHVQGVQIMCSKRAKRVQSEEHEASINTGCFLSSLIRQEIRAFLGLRILLTFLNKSPTRKQKQKHF